MEMDHQGERQVVDEPRAQVAADGDLTEVPCLGRRPDARLHLPDPTGGELLGPESNEVGVLQQASKGQPVHRDPLHVLAEDEVRRQEVHQRDQR